MTQSFNDELKQQWKENILKQRQSNLSIAAWCRQNKITLHKFYYWQSKLFPKLPHNRSAFIEVVEVKSSPSTGVILEYQGFNILLSEYFDPSVLKKCLEVLKKC